MHFMTDVAATVKELLKSVADVNPAFLPTDEKAGALLTLLDIETQAAELRLRVMACADDVAEREGFHTLATWLAHHGHVRRGDAAADLRLATALDREQPVLAAALREARINLPQARVIAAAVAELPLHVGRDVIARAEAELVRLAADHDPKELTVLGRRILEIVDPQRFEDEERRKLDDAERRASEKQRLRIRALGDGTTRISGLVPDAVAARLTTYLHAFTNPRLGDGTVRSNSATGDNQQQPGACSFGNPTSHPRRLAEAFGQLLETLDPSRLPIHGGDATHVTVTIGLESLESGLGIATLDNGTSGDGLTTMTASQVRRLACTAQIVPAVLGADSEILDLGRAQRLFTKAQRRALLLRDTTCRTEGCDIPGTWAEAHHQIPWSQGGTTDLDNALLLCSRHHHRAHDATYDMRRLPNGDYRFARRR